MNTRIIPKIGRALKAISIVEIFEPAGYASNLQKLAFYKLILGDEWHTYVASVVKGH